MTTSSTARTGLVVSLLCAVVAGLWGYWRCAGAAARSDEDLRRRGRELAAELAAEMERVAATHGDSAARSLVARAESGEGLTIRWVRSGPDAPLEARPAFPIWSIDGLRPGGVVQIASELNGRRVHTYVLAPGLAEERAALEISEAPEVPPSHRHCLVSSVLQGLAAAVLSGALFLALSDLLAERR